MARTIKAGTTDVSVVIKIIDSTDGTPETGVVFNTAGIDLQYRRELAASVAITEATLAALTTAHTDGGFLHIGNGYYRLDLPDSAVATGATGVLVHGTVTGMVVLGEYIELVAYDPADGVRLGLTALPNAAADAAGGLPISDAGGLDLDAKLAATNEVTAARMGALTDWIDGGRLDLILDGVLLDTAEIGAAGAGLTNINLPNQTMDIVGNITGNLSGSVGSVTGAVGSVTGAVGSVTTVSDKTGYRLSATGVDDVLDEVVEGTTTMRQMLRGFASALLAKLSGAATTTVSIRDLADTKARITATVDADGNRSAVTLDLT